MPEPEICVMPANECKWFGSSLDSVMKPNWGVCVEFGSNFYECSNKCGMDSTYNNEFINDCRSECNIGNKTGMCLQDGSGASPCINRHMWSNCPVSCTGKTQGMNFVCDYFTC